MIFSIRLFCSVLLFRRHLVSVTKRFMGESHVIASIMTARNVLWRHVDLLARLHSCSISLDLQLWCRRNHDLARVHHVLRSCLQSRQVQHNGRLLHLWHLRALFRLLDAPGGHASQLGGAHWRVEGCIYFVLLAYLFVKLSLNLKFFHCLQIYVGVGLLSSDCLFLVR